MSDYRDTQKHRDDHFRRISGSLGDGLRDMFPPSEIPDDAYWGECRKVSDEWARDTEIIDGVSASALAHRVAREAVARLVGPCKRDCLVKIYEIGLLEQRVAAAKAELKSIESLMEKP